MKQIYNNGPGSRTDKAVSINPRGITILKKFRDKIKVTHLAGLYIDDDGFLCLKFYEDSEAPLGCFKVQRQGKDGTTPVILVSSKMLDSLGIKVGQYDVTEKDGFFVTDCKTTNQ